jgi:hypothetical protein
MSAHQFWADTVLHLAASIIDMMSAKLQQSCNIKDSRARPQILLCRSPCPPVCCCTHAGRLLLLQGAPSTRLEAAQAGLQAPAAAGSTGGSSSWQQQQQQQLTAFDPRAPAVFHAVCVRTVSARESLYMLCYRVTCMQLCVIGGQSVTRCFCDCV